MGDGPEIVGFLSLEGRQTTRVLGHNSASEP